MKKQVQLRGSLLDRLTDLNPGSTEEPTSSYSLTLSKIRQSIKVDLERLLNTKVYWKAFTNDVHSELAFSLVNYGLPDFISMNMVSEESRSDLVKTIEGVIKRYEPRFEKVNVSILNNKDTVDRTLRLTIDVVLKLDDFRETMVFDTIIEANQYLFKVVEGR